MNDGVEMDVESTAGSLTAVDDAGKTTAEAWRGHRGTIDAKEPAIGSGPLAEAFRSVYTPEPVKRGADRCLAAIPTLVQAGRVSIDHYIEADGLGAASFPN